MKRLAPLAYSPPDFVLETAINGAADIIASFNVRDMAEGAARFGISLERPGEILRRFRR